MTSTSSPNSRTPGAQIRASEQSDILTMKAQGISNDRISKALGIGNRQVKEIAANPQNQAEIHARRLFLKSRTSQRLEALIEPAWDMAHEAAVNRDAKAYDAAMRGLHAQEKISASVAGENQRLQVDHSGEVSVNREPVIVQLQQLIAMVKGKTDDPQGSQQLNP